MEDMLLNPDKSAEDYLGKTYKDQFVTQEDVDEAIAPAINAYIQFAEDREIEIELPEEQVKLFEDVGGTSDIICANTNTVFIIDWKFGYHPVSAVNNPQGLFYAMCARRTPHLKSLFDGKESVCTVIIQPTTEKVISYHYTSLDELDYFEHVYLDAVGNEDVNKQITGEYCKFCPAMPICPAKTGQAVNALRLDPEILETLPDALDMADEVIEWAQSVKKLAHEQAELGTSIRGYKLVDKRAIRKWKDEKEVEQMLKRARSVKIGEVVQKKIMSPTQLEKFCKKKGLDFYRYDAYIEKVSSGTTLTTEDDPRPKAFNAANFIDVVNRLGN
jgi:hypothetical protein